MEHYVNNNSQKVLQRLAASRSTRRPNRAKAFKSFALQAPLLSSLLHHLLLGGLPLRPEAVPLDLLGRSRRFGLGGLRTRLGLPTPLPCCGGPSPFALLGAHGGLLGARGWLSFVQDCLNPLSGALKGEERRREGVKKRNSESLDV